MRENGQSRHRSIGRARRGFTILELTVVLIMVALIAGISVPRLNYERYRADAAMRTVRSILQGAQRQAIMRQTNVVVGFNEAAKLLEIVEDTDNDCAYDAGERLTTRPLEEGAKFALPPSPNAGPTPATAVSGPNMCTIRGLPAIQFLRDGATSTDLDVYLTSSRGSSRDFRHIRVLMASGRTEASRFNGSTWQRTN